MLKRNSIVLNKVLPKESDLDSDSTEGIIKSVSRTIQRLPDYLFKNSEKVSLVKKIDIGDFNECKEILQDILDTEEGLTFQVKSVISTTIKDLNTILDRRDDEEK